MNEEILRLAKSCGFETKSFNAIDDDEIVVGSEIITERLEAFYRAAFNAGRASLPVKVPEGWQLVPKEPTFSMMKAADNYCEEMSNRPKGIWYWGRLYEAMLAAAPKEGRE